MSDGFVHFVDKMGTDLSVVNAARVSYGRVSYELNDRDRGVMGYLMEHRHGTPWEAFVMQFRVRCTIKEARDWFRYRFSSFNEHSTRYSPRIDDVYIPEGKAVRTQLGKPGHYTMAPITDLDIVASIQAEFREMYRHAELHYNNLLDFGLAQELASMAYPLGQMTEFIWTVNGRSLMNFLSQRMDGASLLELRRKAYAVYGLTFVHFPETLRLWSEHRQPDMMTDWSDDDLIWLPEYLR